MQPRVILGVASGRVGGVAHGREMLLHQPAEIGQMRQMAFAPEQLAAKLQLERANGATERSDADAALVGGAREIQHLACRQKVADLMHFHGSLKISRDSATRAGSNRCACECA